jgi:hypothetical protein
LIQRQQESAGIDRSLPFRLVNLFVVFVFLVLGVIDVVAFTTEKREK